jgi:toxoflavin biosynthesis protein ToxC
MFHTGPIAAIASLDRYIATAGYDNQIILWDTTTKQSLARACHDHLANHCAFSHDGKYLVSASSDFTARIWELPSLRLKTCLSGHSDDVDMAVFSPDDQWIATCALDRTIRIFDINGQCHKILLGHTGNIISVAWRPDGKSLVSSGVDGTVREWDTLSGECIQCHNNDGIRTDSFVIANDGTIYAGDDQGRIIAIKGSNKLFFPAHEAGIKKIVYNAAHQRLVTLSYDRTLAIWAIEASGNLRLINRTLCPALIWPRSAAIIDANSIAIGTFGSRYALYNAELDQWDLEGIIHDSSLNAILANSSGKMTIGDAGILIQNGIPVANMGSLCNFLVEADNLVLTGGQMGQLFNAMTGEVLYQHHSPLNCGVSFKRKGKLHIAIGSYTGDIVIFTKDDMSKTLQIETTLRPFASAIKGLSASESSLFSVCANTDIVWYNIHTLELMQRINQAHERIANACCRIGNEGFASVSRDKKLRLWLNSGLETYDTPHPNSIKCMSIDDESTVIVSGAYTGTIAIFDLKTRRWIKFERPTSAGISSITYDKTIRKFWASSYDGHLYCIDPRPLQVSGLYEQFSVLQEHCA